jgi:hypothetical protein
MPIELSNPRRKGSEVVVDAKVSDGHAHSVYSVAFRLVGPYIRPSVTSEVPRELMAEIFAAALQFVEKNDEKISGLLFGVDRSNG